MDKRIDNIEIAIQKLADAVHSIDKTLARQEENLKEHMRRTEAAEESIMLLRTEVEPVKKHVARVDGVLKAIGIIATMLAIAGGIKTIIDF